MRPHRMFYWLQFCIGCLHYAGMHVLVTFELFGSKPVIIKLSAIIGLIQAGSHFFNQITILYFLLLISYPSLTLHLFAVLKTFINFCDIIVALGRTLSHTFNCSHDSVALGNSTINWHLSLGQQTWRLPGWLFNTYVLVVCQYQLYFAYYNFYTSRLTFSVGLGLPIMGVRSPLYSVPICFCLGSFCITPFLIQIYVPHSLCFLLPH
jgi:hypothetical protein